MKPFADRAYAATVVLTLALAIGAATAVFSIVDGVLLKPLPYAEPARLVGIREVWQEFADRMDRLPVNERHLEYWRANSRAFESLAQYLVRPVNLTGGGEAAQIRVARASGSLFDVLRTQPALGRALRPSDEPEGAANVVVLGDSLWRRRFSADPQVVGKAAIIDGRPHEIVGVLATSFRLPSGQQLEAGIDAVVPLRITSGWYADHNTEAIGRLRDGANLAQARVELDALQRQVSEVATREAHETVTLSAIAMPLAEQVIGPSRRSLLVLFASIIAVLLIACSNLANLALTRTLARLGDTAVRSALGASRGRLAGAALGEQLVLSLAGCAAGLAVAWAALRVFVLTAPLDLPRIDEVRLDARVLAFAILISLVAGAFIALVPAWRAAGSNVQQALRLGGYRVASDRKALRGHGILLALQVGLSVALLVVTGLFIVSFKRVLGAERGFDAQRVLVIDAALPASRYQDEAARTATYDRMLAAVRQVSGVADVASVSAVPLRGESQINLIAASGRAATNSLLPQANYRSVAPGYFETLGVALRRGRVFDDGDRQPGRAVPAVISEAAARLVWPGEDPVGRRFGRGTENTEELEVVGVAAEARTVTFDGTQPLLVYVPHWWRSRMTVSLLVKTTTDAAAVLAPIRRAVGLVDPEIAIGETRPFEALVDRAIAGRRYQARIFTAFGAAALLIAVVGVWAVTSYSVSRRRREMNIRVALGAGRSQVVGLILRDGARPMAAGILAGVAAAAALGGAITSLLFGVQAHDPAVFAAVAAIVAAAGLGTCALAARRGLAIDPAAALREQ